MSEDEKTEWGSRYSDVSYAQRRTPSALLTEWLGDRPPGKALDLACGTGRNTFYLAEKGYEVTAVDISPRAIELAGKAARGKGLNIKWVVADLDDYEMPELYALIMISFFRVSDSMIPRVINALQDGGLLLYESLLSPPSVAGNEAQGHRFHFNPGELRNLFKKLKVINYEERQTDGKESQPFFSASLVAQKE